MTKQCPPRVTGLRNRIEKPPRGALHRHRRSEGALAGAWPVAGETVADHDLIGEGITVLTLPKYGTIRLWQTKDDSPVTTLEGHNGAVFAVGLDHEGRLVASTGMDGTIRFWSIPVESELHTVRAHQGAIWGMVMSADGRLVAGGVRSGAVQLWDARTGSAAGTLRLDRLYERMDITGVKGLTEAQKAGLRSLGAVEQIK